MGVVVGRDSSYIECDIPGCRRKTPRIAGDNSGQSEVVKYAQRNGWHHNLTTGSWYCNKNHKE